jgi:peptide/nickel transport system permease protein
MGKSPNRQIWILGLVLAVLFFVGLFPSLVTSREALKSGYTAGLAPPTSSFPLGTDQLGRDVFAWVVDGTRVAFYVGTICTLISFLIALLGMFAGYYGGKVDQVLMRVTDLTMAVPRFVLVVVFTTLLGSKIVNIILIIGALSWPTLARIMRAETLSLRERSREAGPRTSSSSRFSRILCPP